MRSVLALLLVSSLGGCSKPASSEPPAAPPRASPADPPPAARDAISAPLVRVDASGTLEIRPLPATLVVTPGEVLLLRGASTTVVSSEILGRFDPTTASDHLIAPLTERLAELLTSDEAHALSRPDTALVALAPDVTMGTLVDVLYSAGRAGMAAYEFAVDTEQGPRSLSVLPPRFCAEPATTGDPCVRPQISFADDGMLLSAQSIDEHHGCPVAHRDSGSAWSGRNISGPDGACPTAWDSEHGALSWFLDELPRLGRVCRHALVTAEVGVRWSRLGPAFARLHAELEHGLVIEAGGTVPTGCIEPLDLGAHAGKRPADG